VKIAFVMIETK